MGFLSKLFGLGSANKVNVQSNAVASKRRVHQGEAHSNSAPYGSKDNPIVIAMPPNITEMREFMKSTFLGNAKVKDVMPNGLHDAMAIDDAPLDGMISEMLKMTILGKMLGEEHVVWECGPRFYLKGAIQSQEIRFKDGRESITIYFDFSQFGAF